MSDEFISKYVAPFQDVQFIQDNRGWIVWRVGTGENVELLHIRTSQKRRGYGRSLVYGMLNEITTYHSVFGFTRDSNEEAKKFYGALGFNLLPFTGLYKHGHTVLFWQSYEILVSAQVSYSLSQ